MAQQHATVPPPVMEHHYIHSGVDEVYCGTLKGQAEEERKPHLTSFVHSH